MTVCTLPTGYGRLRPVVVALAFGWAFAFAPHAAGAETRVSGGSDTVRVEARQASLDEVLGALAAKFNLRYRSKVALDRPVNGVFSGSLSRVMARLLDGYDHVVKRGSDGIEVTILGISPRTSSPGEPS